MITDVKAKIDQMPPSVSAEGDLEFIKQSKLGQIFTADWKERFLLAGKIWSAGVGIVAAGADVTEVVGGGDGTVVDANQPELGIGVPAGYYLIPISCRCGVHSLSDAADDEVLIVLFADRSATVPTDGTKTAVTPLNSLDGGGSFPGTAFKEATADITNPTFSDILDFEAYQALGTAVSAIGLKMNYNPLVPRILAGPCSVYLCWGGTIAAHGAATLEVACVPTSWFPVS